MLAGKRQETNRQTERDTSKEECIKWLNKLGTFTQDVKGWRKITRTVYQNLDDLQNLQIKLTVNARAEKAWLPNEFPLSYFRKKSKQDMEFPGVLKKEHVEIPGFK